MLDGQAILEHMAQVMTSLGAVRTLDALAETVHQAIEDTVVVEYSGVYMLDYVSQTLRTWRMKGFSPEERAEAERTAWERHPGWVMRNKQILHVPDTEKDNRTQNSKRAFQVRARLWVPILNKGEGIGALGLASTTPHAFTDEHLTVLQYAATMTGFMYENLRDKWLLETQLREAEERKQELVALSSPLVEVWNGVLVLPIIGRMDEARAQQIMEKLLQIISSRNVRAVILDLTGVAAIDTLSVQHLGRMQRAVRLLGSDCLLSGISGQTAALMSQFGSDLETWKTFASVRQALGAFANRSAPSSR